MSSLALLTPDWPAPPGVGAAMATRQGGVSLPPFASLNLRPSVLDTPGGAAADSAPAVAENLRRYAEALGARPVYLTQVHGSTVLDLDRQDSPADRPAMADAAVTTRLDLACTVLVADCLPVLLTDQRGRAVAAAHAGWRGLAAGVLENTVQALCRAAACDRAQVVAWLGPCIGPLAFEVGPDVLQAFGVPAHSGPSHSASHSPSHSPSDPPCPGTKPTPGKGAPNVSPEAATAFRYAPRADGTPRWRADLTQLAHQRLWAAGVRQISASGLCTVSDASRFFSFRRDGLTGRMAASIWRRG